MRIGVMGVHYGHISMMVRSALEAPDGELVGLVEADDDLYAKYTQDVKIPRYRTLDEMLEKARPELVMEGIAHTEKPGFVEACAAAGAHVLLDKPLCRTIQEWQRIAAAAESHGIRLSMWFTSRSYPPFIALREAVLAGDLGEIISLVSTHPHRLGTQAPQAPSWYFDPEAYVGIFHDLAGHGVDQVRWLTGAEYVGVHALGTLKRHTVPPRRLEMDHVQASFQMSNGSLALLTADWLTPTGARSWGDTRFILMGTEGSAHLRAYAEDHVLVVSNRKGVYEPEMPPDRNNIFVQNMIEALSRGEEGLVNTADVLAVAKAGITAEESARRGGEFLKIEA